MEAPEKIYLTKNLFGELRDGWDALPSDVFISVESTLALMPCARLDTSNDGNYRVFWNKMYSEWHTNVVDACVELITRKEKEQ